MLNSNPLLNINKTLLNRFTLKSYLGGGAYGAVYYGTDEDLRVDVALKMPLDVQNNAYFISEARILNRLKIERKSKRVPEFYELHEIEGLKTIVLGYCQGGALQSRLQQKTRETYTPLVQLVACEVMMRVAEALEDGHALGILHRDVKPANIFFTDDGFSGALLGDFGVGKDMSNADRALTGVGTSHFVAPEVILGSGATMRSDVYSFGLTLYILLTGFSPYQTGLSQDERIKAKLSGDLVPISEREAAGKQPVNPMLAAIVQQSLSLEPLSRQESGAKLRRQMTDAFMQMTIQAAEDLMAEGDQQRAESMLRSLADKLPQELRPHLELARYLARIGRTHDAGQVYDRACTELPRSAVLLFERAFFLASVQGKTEEAVALMLLALELGENELSAAQRKDGAVLLAKWRSQTDAHGQVQRVNR